MEDVSAQTGSRLSRALPSARLWALFLGGMNIHLLVRSLADNAGMPAYSPAMLEHAIFHGYPTVWLQHWLGTHNALINSAAILLHASWFFVPFGLAILVQARCGRSALGRLVVLQLALLFLADAMYAMWPTRPPWMSIEMTRVLGSASATRLDDNPVAALPSLHVAVPALYALWLWRADDRVLRRVTPFVALWATGVAWCVVYSGEHYLIDGVAGVLLAGVVYALGSPVLAAFSSHRGTMGSAAMVCVPSRRDPARPAFRAAASLERVRNQYD